MDHGYHFRPRSSTIKSGNTEGVTNTLIGIEFEGSTMTLTGYHQQAHFKANELELYYNMAPPKGFPKCHHIALLFCSKGDQLQPEECRTVQNCQLLKFKDQLFRKHGIHGPTLLKVDKILREMKTEKRE